VNRAITPCGGIGEPLPVFDADTASNDLVAQRAMQSSPPDRDAGRSIRKR